MSMIDTSSALTLTCLADKRSSGQTWVIKKRIAFLLAYYNYLEWNILSGREVARARITYTCIAAPPLGKLASV